MWKYIFVPALLCLCSGAHCQELNKADLDELPAQEAAPGPVVKRPDAQRLISELSTGLRLSSKQEDRISSAVKKKAAEFDKLMKEYESSSAEEKKWRYRMNDAHYGMRRINQQIPDVVREYLDEEQREAYDAMLRPKPEPAPAVSDAPKPVKKKRLVRRRKAPAAAPAAAPGEDAAGEVMVDKDTSPSGPAPRRPAMKKRPAPRPEPPAEEPPPDEPPALDEEAGEADPGSYP